MFELLVAALLIVPDIEQAYREKHDYVVTCADGKTYPYRHYWPATEQEVEDLCSLLMEEHDESE